MSSFNGFCRAGSIPDNWDVDGANGGRFHNTNSSVTSRFAGAQDPQVPSTATGISVTGFFSLVAADTDGGATCFIEVLDNVGNTVASSNPSIPEGTPSDFNDFREYSASGGSLTSTQVSALKLQATNGVTGGDPNRRIRWDVNGDNVFTVTFTLAAPTSVTTTAASSITGSQATLNGTFNPNGANANWPCYYYFEWGLTTAYGNTTGIVGGNTGSSPVAAAALITGLNSNTVYHYRLVAYNNDNIVFGSDLTFTSGATYSLTLTETVDTVDTFANQGAGVLLNTETVNVEDTLTTLLSLTPSVINLDLVFPTVVDIDVYF